MGVQADDVVACNGVAYESVGAHCPVDLVPHQTKADSSSERSGLRFPCILARAEQVARYKWYCVILPCAFALCRILQLHMVLCCVLFSGAVLRCVLPCSLWRLQPFCPFCHANR